MTGPHVSVLLCEQVVLVPALVAGGGGMEGSGGLRCLKSRKTKVNPALNSFFCCFFFFLLFPSIFGANSSCDRFYILALVTS